MVIKNLTKKVFKIGGLFFILLMLFQLVIAVFPPSAFAISASEMNNSTFEFTDAQNVMQTVTSSGRTIRYTDGKTDDDWTYKQANASDDNGCKSMIAYQNGTPQEGNGTAHFWRNSYVANEQRCYFDFEGAATDDDMYYVIKAKFFGPGGDRSWNELIARGTEEGRYRAVNIKKATPAALAVTHYLLEPEGVIKSADFEKTYTRDPNNPNRFFESNKPCAGKIILNNPKPGDDQRDGGLDTNPCDNNNDTAPVILGTVTKQVRSQIEAENKQNELATENSCESKGGSLGWIICPVLRLLDDGIGAIDDQIENLLFVPAGPFEKTGDLHDAWLNIRNIAYIILVPIMLIMVIGTALGWSFVDAYTVRRAMPRFIMAVLFITLSWEVSTFLIDITNALGTGIYGILTSPFDKIGTSLDVILNDAGLALGFGAIAGFVGAIVIFQGALVGLILLYAFSAFLAILAGFITLAIRQMLLIVLVLISTVAILSWIFPGNDKLWKLWWNTFTKLLLMFPLVMSLIAAGRILAGIASQYQQGVLGVFLAVTAYIAPYFLIPATFKFAGGMFANLSGMVNDRTRGLFDRAKKARQEIASEAHQRNMESRSGVLGKGRLGNTYRRISRLGRDGSWDLFTRQGRSRWQEYQAMVLEQTANKMNEEGGVRAFANDDVSAIMRQVGINRNDFIRQYTALGHTKNEALEALNRAELAVGAKVGTRAMAASALRFRVAHSSTAYEPGVEGLQQMQNEMLEGQRQRLGTSFDMASWMKSNRGRADFSANGFVETESFARGQTTAADQLAGAFKGADPREVVGSHQRTIESFAQQAIQNFDIAVAESDAAAASGNQARIYAAEKQLDIATADLAGIYDTMASISPRKAQEFADNVFERGVVSRKITVRALMEERRNREPDDYGNQPFLDRRREWRNAIDAKSAAAAAAGAVPPPID